MCLVHSNIKAIFKLNFPGSIFLQYLLLKLISRCASYLWSWSRLDLLTLVNLRKHLLMNKDSIHVQVSYRGKGAQTQDTRVYKVNKKFTKLHYLPCDDAFKLNIWLAFQVIDKSLWIVQVFVLRNYKVFS